MRNRWHVNYGGTKEQSMLKISQQSSSLVDNDIFIHDSDEQLKEAHRIVVENDEEWYEEFVVQAIGDDDNDYWLSRNISKCTTVLQDKVVATETSEISTFTIDTDNERTEIIQQNVSTHNEDSVQSSVSDTDSACLTQKSTSKQSFVVNKDPSANHTSASAYKNTGSQERPPDQKVAYPKSRRHRRRRKTRLAYSVDNSYDDIGYDDTRLQKTCRHVVDMDGFRDLLDEEAAWRISVYSDFLRLINAVRMPPFLRRRERENNRDDGGFSSRKRRRRKR
eukprot:CAMPEP_0195300502 /NCGR_PEP_ID=MMETSP0707-20130614/27559_1 /TAXON_ID=33640 /ORGANISM="Asterionellopsis glacialis, Strain CCMP134" /LENGTH=277 /DNA_ID=CAMNT_0040363211 /DNA_START=193 /DNA_END=1026 /DNA_ORIENTATION=-